MVGNEGHLEATLTAQHPRCAERSLWLGHLMLADALLNCVST